MTSRILSTGLILAVLTFAGSAVRAEDVGRGFVSHRAVYDLGLAEAPGGGISSLSGRLVYEFAGSSCEGYQSRFRMVTRMGNDKGEGRLTDLRTTSHEGADGRSFDFVDETYAQGKKVEGSRGRASLGAAGVRVRLDGGGADGREVTLPEGALFPTAHMAAVIEAARAGRHFLDLTLYDGSGAGDHVYETSVVIGQEATGPDDLSGDAAGVAALTAGHRRWPVQLAYFDPTKADGGEQTPDYTMSFLLYDNGVSRRLRLDYGSFRIAARLTGIEALPVATCR